MYHSSQRVCDDVAVLALSRCNTGLAAYVGFPTYQNSLCMRMTHGRAIGRQCMVWNGMESGME